jgi:hypothetical protein
MNEHTKSGVTLYEPPVIEERTSLEGQLAIISSSNPPV